jgi:hypothetical protein
MKKRKRLNDDQKMRLQQMKLMASQLFNAIRDYEADKKMMYSMTKGYESDPVAVALRSALRAVGTDVAQIDGIYSMFDALPDSGRGNDYH